MQNESTEACDDTGVCCQIHPDAAIRYISMEKLIKHHHRGGGGIHVVLTAVFLPGAGDFRAPVGKPIGAE